MTTTLATALSGFYASFTGKASFTPSGFSQSRDPGSTGDSIDLSEHAQSVLAQGNAAADVAESFNLSARERLNKRIDEFAGKLSDFFNRFSLSLDDKTVLSVDQFGDVKADSPYKKKLEEYFKDNPNAAKELKKISKLAALQATEAALQAYVDEKKAAKGNKKLEDIAAEHYSLRTQHIKEIAGNFTFEKGKLTSAALEFADSFKKPQDAQQRTDITV